MWDLSYTHTHHTINQIGVSQDRFDIALQSGHNFLIQNPIEMIKDAMELQDKALQLSCFEF